MSGLKAGLRSAAWAARPNTNGARAWHIEVRESAACNVQMPLMPESLQPAELVFTDSRCRNRACAKIWGTVSGRRYGETLLKDG